MTAQRSPGRHGSAAHARPSDGSTTGSAGRRPRRRSGCAGRPRRRRSQADRIPVRGAPHGRQPAAEAAPAGSRPAASRPGPSDRLVELHALVLGARCPPTSRTPARRARRTSAAASRRRRRANPASSGWARSWRTAPCGTRAGAGCCSMICAALLDRHPERLPDLLAQEPVPHPHRRLVAELLALADLGRPELLVGLLERQHAEGHVAGFVGHDVAGDLLEQGSGLNWYWNPKAARARPSTMICMPR